MHGSVSPSTLSATNSIRYDKHPVNVLSKHINYEHCVQYEIAKQTRLDVKRKKITFILNKQI